MRIYIFIQTYTYICILFASRYPTSPSEGSFLYDCLQEGSQNKEKLQRFDSEAVITGTCKRVGAPECSVYILAPTILA